MPRLERPLLAAPVVLALSAVAAGVAAPQPSPLARLTFVEPKAEVGARDAGWQQAVEGAELAIGRAVRVGGDAVARLELPWMALTLTSGARLRLSDELLLAAGLESGRTLLESDSRDSMKLVTAEAEVRGRGRLVVRREGQLTLVSCLAGRCQLSASAGSVALAAGQGSIVSAGRRPSAPDAIPRAPESLWPAGDPVYVAPHEPLLLRWNGETPAYVVELLPVGREIVLIHREVGSPTLRIELPWSGAFRWRVSARDARGLEGAPSREGLIAVE